MINIYGLKNCDTCRKARKWMDAENITHKFLDVRADGVSEPQITAWVKAVGWEVLLNKRGTTWRAFDEAIKADVDETKAIQLMATHPALIKRPVFEVGSDVLVGFLQATQDHLKG